ncbi:DUF2793 domain-containing protein [Daeguia caeni]|uniref:DUF2793 domain-containing protein n=1 Tax=Daeguia caeni TaxID=439612 RepID=A0ABV9H7Y4_9HYPH
MDQTPNLNLPFILPSQAQKHVTHNEALRILDAVIQLRVLSRTLEEPPATPDEGSRYIVAAAATGDWVGHSGDIACFIDGGWLFITPASGWLAYVEDEAKLRLFDGTNWNDTAYTLPSTLTPDMLGVNTTPDSVNRFALSAAASLFNHAGSGHQIKVNKQTASATTSFLYQTNWVGFAEMGLNGSNDFSIKVSDNSGTWREAIKIDHATGNVAIGGIWPQTCLHVNGPIRPASYTVATKPSASSHGAGAIIFITDSSSGAEMAYSDGSVWRSFRTGNTI